MGKFCRLELRSVDYALQRVYGPHQEVLHRVPEVWEEELHQH